MMSADGRVVMISGANRGIGAAIVRRLRAAGFRLDSQRVLPLFNPAYDDNTYSARIIDMIVAFVVRRGGVTQAEADAWAFDLRRAGERGDYFFSLNRYLFAAHRSP